VFIFYYGFDGTANKGIITWLMINFIIWNF
jgi:hypothetical protein